MSESTLPAIALAARMAVDSLDSPLADVRAAASVAPLPVIDDEATSEPGPASHEVG